MNVVPAAVQYDGVSSPPFLCRQAATNLDRSLVADNQGGALQFNDPHFPNLRQGAGYRYPAAADELGEVFTGPITSFERATPLATCPSADDSMLQPMLHLLRLKTAGQTTQRHLLGRFDFHSQLNSG